MLRKAASRTFGVLLVFVIMVWAVDASAQAAPGSIPGLQFRTHQIVDQRQGLALATIAVPAHWHVSSRVQWTYSDVNHPIRAFVRAEAPDRSGADAANVESSTKTPNRQGAAVIRTDRAMRAGPFLTR